ncbi:fibronectin type III domain-containing protein, partial [Candidatus Sumerlaeota bacterium]|nr:fibronectin type III domain-containing protein [Candidatus Sumerlaeota bacterium]
MKKMRHISLVCILLFFFLDSVIFAADYYSYNGSVAQDVKRDRIMAIAQDFNSLLYYLSSDNAKAQCSGTTPPDTGEAWKTGVKYCWGGETTTKQYLDGLIIPLTAGNKNTGGGSSYGQCSVGDDCSGFVSNAWTSPRYATSGFPGISDDIEWDDLRAGDALNNAGSHIRLYDYFTNHTHTSMLYECTSGGGLIWAMTHRSLSRDDNYQPIRYNNPSGYKVWAFPEPVILYITKTGIERMEIRWDGEAELGFHLYQSVDGSTWSRIREYAELTPGMRYCEVSGLLPDTTYYFKMTSSNSGPVETIDSNVIPFRMKESSSRVILVDGADRYRQQKSSSHTFLTRVGKALESCGIGFDFCSNESVIDEQIDLADYKAAVWILAEESTFDETFSFAEQTHAKNFLKSEGCLFVSGAEIGWDLDYRHNSSSYKNGSPNDRPFYNEYLCASYVGDDADTYNVQGVPGSIFDGLTFSFDDGTHGTYDVTNPDQIAPYYDATIGLAYQGGSGGNACLYHSSPTEGTIVNMGFPFETIYNESDRNGVMKSILNYFTLSPEAPTIKTAIRASSDTVTITWQGFASRGFRLFQKTGSGSWNQIKGEGDLPSDSRSTTFTDLSPLTRYAFKLQAVNSGGASADSDALCVSLGDTGSKILIVDGYDRWNSQRGGVNHALLEIYAKALTANNRRYDSCANEEIARGIVSLHDYDIVMWMCGEESTESETFGYEEQVLIQNFLKAGGKLFVSGSEIGWDLVEEANTSNNYSNGNSNDTP